MPHTKTLDPDAVRKANADLQESHKDDTQFWSDHPDGQLTTSPEDRKLRKEWMRAYKKVGSTCACATASGAHAPKPEAPKDNASLPREPKPNPKIVCGLVSAEITCQHGRKSGPSGLLEVVASGVGDTVKCTSAIKGGCGSHPKWTIDGYWKSEKIGTSATLNAINWRNWDAPSALPGLFNWAGDLRPHEYSIGVECCSGASRSFDVSCYPSDSTEVSFQMPKELKSLEEEFNDALKEILDPSFKWEFATGAAKFNAKWMEVGAGDPYKDKFRAYYKWTLSVGFNPLVSLKYRQKLGPLAALPPELARFGTAYFFVEIKGEINLNATGQKTSPDDWDLKDEAEGTLRLTLGGSAFLVNEDVLSVEVAGYSGFTVNAEPEWEGEKPAMKIGTQWDGIKAYCTFKAMFQSYNREFTLVDEHQFNDVIWPKWGEDENRTTAATAGER